jgi:hypothetical protein
MAPLKRDLFAGQVPLAASGGLSAHSILTYSVVNLETAHRGNQPRCTLRRGGAAMLPICRVGSRRSAQEEDIRFLQAKIAVQPDTILATTWYLLSVLRRLVA